MEGSQRSSNGKPFKNLPYSSSKKHLARLFSFLGVNGIQRLSGDSAARFRGYAEKGREGKGIINQSGPLYLPCPLPPPQLDWHGNGTVGGGGGGPEGLDPPSSYCSSRIGGRFAPAKEGGQQSQRNQLVLVASCAWCVGDAGGHLLEVRQSRGCGGSGGIGGGLWMSWTSFSNLGWPAGSGPSFAQASLADEMASGMRRDHLSVTSKRSCAKLLLGKGRSLWLKLRPEAPFPLGVCAVHA